MDREFNDFITQLQSLHSVHTRQSFRDRVNNVLIPSLTETNRNFSFFALPAFRTALVIAILLVVTGSGVILASSNSQPGDFLYPVIHTFRQVQRTLNSDPTEEAITHLQNADNSIKKINQAIKEKNSQQIQQETQKYENEVQQTKTAGQQVSHNDQKLQDTINQHLENNVKQLEHVQQIVPTTAQPAIEHAIQVSSQDQSKVGNGDKNQNNDQLQLKNNNSQNNQDSNSDSHQSSEQKLGK